mmetsp:Transcript_271/g.929  ORF Transcript_271/g.929 Transcript_271/m.929 type:complete len:213 (+) Transcript_271:1143-1781(+)
MCACSKYVPSFFAMISPSFKMLLASSVFRKAMCTEAMNRTASDKSFRLARPSSRCAMAFACRAARRALSASASSRRTSATVSQAVASPCWSPRSCNKDFASRAAEAAESKLPFARWASEIVDHAPAARRNSLACKNSSRACSARSKALWRLSSAMSTFARPTMHDPNPLMSPSSSNKSRALSRALLLSSSRLAARWFIPMFSRKTASARRKP